MAGGFKQGWGWGAGWVLAEETVEDRGEDMGFSQWMRYMIRWRIKGEKRARTLQSNSRVWHDIQRILHRQLCVNDGPWSFFELVGWQKGTALAPWQLVDDTMEVLVARTVRAKTMSVGPVLEWDYFLARGKGHWSNALCSVPLMGDPYASDADRLRQWWVIRLVWQGAARFRAHKAPKLLQMAKREEQRAYREMFTPNAVNIGHGVPRQLVLTELQANKGKQQIPCALKHLQELN